MQGPPAQERLAGDEQIVAAVIAAVGVEDQMPEVRHTLPPQPVDAIGERRVIDRDDRAVAGDERGRIRRRSQSMTAPM